MAGSSAVMSTTKGMVWLFLGLAFFSNILYMAGLAALQYACNYNFFPERLEDIRMPAAFGMSDLFRNCGTVFRFYWWNFAFTCATLISIGIAAATRLGLHYSRAFWVGMIATCLFMNMVACEAFLGWEKIYNNVSSYWWLARWRATVAGAIINVIWLIFLMMAVGTDWEHGGGHTEDLRQHHNHSHDEAKVTPGVHPGPNPPAMSV